MNPPLRYYEGYRFITAYDYTIPTKILPPTFIHVDGFLRLDTYGKLFIFAGYAWDGPSGPTIDTKNFMVGSLVHDAFYQLMRARVLDPEIWRERVDDELVRLTKLDGMSSLRAAWVHAGVRFGGGPAARDLKPILTAP